MFARIIRFWMIFFTVVHVSGRVKEGKCPAVEQTDSAATCAHECSYDRECPNIQKCCRNECGGFACTKPECDTSQSGFSQKNPTEMLANGKCPSQTMTQSYIQGHRLCCLYEWSASPEPACPVEFTEPMDNPGCSMSSGNCPNGYTCQSHNLDGWHTCCRDVAPPSCEDTDVQCGVGEVCVLEDAACESCDPQPTCKACTRVCPANLVCKYGQKKDEIGCDLCECNPTPVYCEGITCSENEKCSRIDRTGIQCDCVPGACYCPPTYESICIPINPGECGLEPWVCDDRCEHGYIPNVNGCPTCEHCMPDPYPASKCPVLECESPCADYKAVVPDSQGCPTCECYDPDQQCPLPGCVEGCNEPLGKYAYDEQGCHGCTCVASVTCPQFNCTCPKGRKLSKDINGCEKCECIQDDVCDSRCNNNCEYGAVKDDNDCPTCQCWQPNPCDEITCDRSSDEVCRTVMVAKNNKMEPVSQCVPFWPDPDCGDIACLIDCKYGHAYDERGCLVCHCDPYAYPKVGDGGDGNHGTVARGGFVTGLVMFFTTIYLWKEK